MSIENWKNKKFKGSNFNAWSYAESLDECREKGEPYSIVYFAVGNNTIIATGCDPLSPREFLERNFNNTFRLDLNKQPKRDGSHIIYYAKIENDSTDFFEPYNDFEDEENSSDENSSDELIVSGNSNFNLNQDIDGLTKFKVLDLWPEIIRPTGVKALVGRLSKISIVDLGLRHKFESFDHTGWFFIISHDSKLSSYLRSFPEEVKTINLKDFVETKDTMKGISYKSFHHIDFLIEVGIKNDKYFNYLLDYDENDVLNKFNICLKSSDSKIWGKPDDVDYSLGILDGFLSVIAEFINNLTEKDLTLFTKEQSGFCFIEVIFTKDAPNFILTRFSSSGIEIVGIQQYIEQIKNKY